MNVARVLGIGSLGVGILLAAACGSSVTGTGGAGGATGGGSTGTIICADEAPPCCDPQNANPCCAPCTTTGTGDTTATGTSTGVTTGTGGATTGTGGSVTTGTGGAGQSCGGFVGSTCPSDQYCSFPDHECGGNDGAGFCEPLPAGCPEIYAPVCGCDGMVYDNSCFANAAGVDVSDLGNCKPPPGMFGCGSGFCQLGSQYCMIVPSGVEDGATSYTCENDPAGCGSAPSCACLSQVTCGGNCQSTSDGGLEVTCLVE